MPQQKTMPISSQSWPNKLGQYRIYEPQVVCKGVDTRHRRSVNTILEQAQPPTPNITKEQQEALKSPKEDNSIMVLPADKGRASVILDADTYHAKMSALIDSGSYQLPNKDPTDRLTRKLSEKLLTLKRNGHISEAVYNKIRPRHKQPPRIYGLPKIH